MSAPRVAVVTVAHGRHAHLAEQQRSLSAVAGPADDRVVVAMGDPRIPAVVGYDDVVDLPLPADGRLPLAAARNLGAAEALRRGAEVLVFLDVDCLVGPGTVAAYAAAVADQPDVVWCGPVTYLSPDDRPYPLERLAELDDPHPARPAPAPGARERSDDWALFWSLSFALSTDAWRRTGGFDEAYTGYGAEDTDLGQRARAAGLGLGWLGDAPAYHQHHPTSDPPVQHAADIVRNGRLFAARWGWWPMGGWLEQLAARGVVVREDDGWRLVP